MALLGFAILSNIDFVFSLAKMVDVFTAIAGYR